MTRTHLRMCRWLTVHQASGAWAGPGPLGRGSQFEVVQEFGSERLPKKVALTLASWQRVLTAERLWRSRPEPSLTSTLTV